MAKKHNGNLDIYGVVTLGADISAAQYVLPHYRGDEGESIVMVNGEAVFTNVAPYIDIAQVSGGSEITNNVTYLMNAVDSISGAVDTFAELLDTPKPNTIVDSHEGEIVIVHPNASIQSQKLEYSGVVLSDLVANIQYLIDTSGSGGEVTNQQLADISGSLEAKIDSINVIGSGSVIVVESPLNTFTVSISADVGNGPDVTEKLIPIASALLPAISGADLSSRTTGAGMLFDSVDFSANYEVAYFNFPMSENFNLGSTVYLKMKMIAGAAGTADFQVTIEDLENGEDWTAATGHTTISFTHTFSGANTIEDETVTVLSPTYHNIKQGDLVIISIRRVGGSLLGDASIVSMKLAW